MAADQMTSGRMSVALHTCRAYLSDSTTRILGAITHLLGILTQILSTISRVLGTRLNTALNSIYRVTSTIPHKVVKTYCILIATLCLFAAPFWVPNTLHRLVGSIPCLIAITLCLRAALKEEEEEENLKSLQTE